MEIFDCQDAESRSEGIATAVSAVMANHLIIIPTDTGYALAGNSFSSAATSRIRSIKGMDDNAPLQVLIGAIQVLDGVASLASPEARSLAYAFWPGPLSMIVPSTPTLQWDIGGAHGYVQLRVPDNPVAQELLQLTGPLAASVARQPGKPAVENTDDVGALQHHVAVFLDYGILKSDALSTIVDCSSEKVAVLRRGLISVGQIVDVLNIMPELP